MRTQRFVPVYKGVYAAIKAFRPSKGGLKAFKPKAFKLKASKLKASKLKAFELKAFRLS